jgi:hypothetical protein
MPKNFNEVNFNEKNLNNLNYIENIKKIKERYTELNKNFISEKKILNNVKKHKEHAKNKIKTERKTEGFARYAKALIGIKSENINSAKTEYKEIEIKSHQNTSKLLSRTDSTKLELLNLISDIEKKEIPSYEEEIEALNKKIKELKKFITRSNELYNKIGLFQDTLKKEI